MNTLNSWVTRMVFLYHKFQHMILTLFFIGLFDLIMYSDGIVSLFAFPELAPLVVLVLIGFGIYNYRKQGRNK